VADGVIQTEAKKNEEENAPAGAETLIAEQDTVEEAQLGSALRDRSGRVGLGEVRVGQGISSSLELLAVMVRDRHARISSIVEAMGAPRQRGETSANRFAAATD